MNGNIVKFYEFNRDTLTKIKAFLTDVFGSEEKLDTALRLFRTRYSLISHGAYSDRSQWDKERLQAKYTSDKCLKAVFGDVINTEVIERIQAYDCLLDHVRTLEEFLDNETAVLIRDYYTTEIDDHEAITIGYLDRYKDGVHPEYLTLTNDYRDDGYTTEGTPVAEKRQKAVAYWKQNGIL